MLSLDVCFSSAMTRHEGMLGEAGGVISVVSASLGLGEGGRAHLCSSAERRPGSVGRHSSSVSNHQSPVASCMYKT